MSEISAGWAVLSGFIIAGLGVTALLGGRSRIRGALPFGFLGVVWGLQIVVVNYAVITVDRAAAEFAYLAALAMFIVLPFLLTTFIREQTLGRPGPLLRAAPYIAAFLALLATSILWMAPELLYWGIIGSTGPHFVRWGPLYYFLVALPVYAAFAFGFIAVWRSHWQAPTTRLARPLFAIAAGLGLYVSFTSSYYATFYLSVLPSSFTAENVTASALFISLGILMVAFGIRALWRIRNARTQDESRQALILGLAILVPLVWGIVEGLLNFGPLPGLRTIGIWRIAAVAAVAYGIALWRVADLPRRTARYAATGVGAAGASAGGLAASGLTSLVVTAPFAIVAVGLITAGVSFTPLLRWSRQLFGTNAAPTSKSVDNEIAYGERVEAYRAAVEAAVARDRLEGDADFLAALREGFRITMDEHRLIVHLAKRSVLVMSEGKTELNYERLRLLGEGSSGRTWLARDRRRDRFVVIKEPLPHWQQDPRIHKAVHAEAKIASKVRHPNVVRTEALLEDNQPLILMEYAEGGTLRDLMRARGVMYWKDARDITLDVLNGLAAVHDHGIVHRDIKPANIFFDRDGAALIGDFGIARFQENRGTMVDRANVVEGTKSYMAPETSHSGVSDERSDLYGVAAVLHACLFGSPPGQTSVIYAQNDIPQGLLSGLRKGLERDPDERHQTAAEFAQALAEIRG